MNEQEIFNGLLDALAAKLRPMIYEIVNEVISKTTPAPQETKQEDFLWTIKDVTNYFGCSNATVFLWRKKGLIKSHKIGNKVYYKKRELEKALKDRNM